MQQEFDGRYVPAARGFLQAVGEDDEPAVTGHDAKMDFEHAAAPEAGERVGAERGIVKNSSGQPSQRARRPARARTSR